MKLREILRVKGTDVHCIGPDALLDEVVQELVRHNVGSLMVCEAVSRGADIRVIGIITERDVLRSIANRAEPLVGVRVADAMSADLVTADPDDSIQHAMRLMTSRRIRHLPITSDGQLQGIVSIGDIVKSHHDQLEMENHFMCRYIRGEGAELATALGHES